MDVDCDGIDYQCKVRINPPNPVLVVYNILEYRAIQMVKIKPILVLLQPMKFHSLLFQTNSLQTILTSFLAITLLQSFGAYSFL